MSKDQLAWRAKFGVLAPSTNSIVEADFNAMHVPGVTPLFSRIHIYDADLSSEAQMEKLRVQLDESIDHAVDLVCTAEVDYMVMGMSAETFWDGKDGNEAFKRRIKERSGGLDVATGAEGCERALNKFGAKTIGVITPYQENADKQVIGFFKGTFGGRVGRNQFLPHADGLAPLAGEEVSGSWDLLDESEFSHGGLCSCACTYSHSYC